MPKSYRHFDPKKPWIKGQVLYCVKKSGGSLLLEKSRLKIRTNAPCNRNLMPQMCRSSKRIFPVTWFYFRMPIKDSRPLLSRPLLSPVLGSDLVKRHMVLS